MGRVHLTEGPTSFCTLAYAVVAGQTRGHVEYYVSELEAPRTDGKFQ